MSEQIAREILRQLGGQKFIGMTGSKNFSYEGNSLTFNVPASLTRKRASGVKITLNRKDLYDLESFKIRNYEVISIASYNDIANDNLQRTFTQMTGLETKL